VLKGQKVTVLLYGGNKGDRRVVAEKGDIVVICSDEEYSRAERERREPEGIGFPREDVQGLVCP
jgi:hypothetical protein